MILILSSHFSHAPFRYAPDFIQSGRSGKWCAVRTLHGCIRPIALGKKNWLFAGSERAGQRAAVIQTLLGTAKLNGFDPSAWLKDTLEKLPTWPNSRIDELLPFAVTD